MGDEIPQWAIERTCDLANEQLASERWSYRLTYASFDRQMGQDRAVALAFAAYIAAHEEPPVDQLYEAVKAVVELGRYDTREQVALLRHELAERGLEIVEKKS